VVFSVPLAPRRWRLQALLEAWGVAFSFAFFFCRLIAFARFAKSASCVSGNFVLDVWTCAAAEESQNRTMKNPTNFSSGVVCTRSSTVRQIQNICETPNMNIDVAPDDMQSMIVFVDVEWTCSCKLEILVLLLCFKRVLINSTSPLRILGIPVSTPYFRFLSFKNVVRLLN